MSFNCYSFDCNKRDLKQGVQCAIQITTGDLWFNETYCSFECLNEEMSTPHLFKNKLVEHFWSDKLEEDPSPCNPPSNKPKHDAFIKKYKAKFLGEVSVSKKIQRESSAMTKASLFLLGKQ